MKTSPLTLVLNHNGIEIEERERRHVDAGVARLESWTRRFPERALQVSIRLHERDGVHTVNLVLELGNRSIVAHDSAPHLLAAIDRTFRKATRQLREFKSMLRRDHLHKSQRDARLDLPAMAEAGVSEAVRQRDLADFRAQAGSHVGRLTRFLGREMQSLATRLPEFRASVEDLVEETLARAFERFGEKPWALPVTSWLYAVAMDVLEGQMRGRHEATMPLDGASDVPHAPTAGDDLYDGLHRLLFRGEIPDDDSRPAALPEPDVLMSSSEDPSDAAEAADLHRRIAQLLGELPALWRRGFLLHFVEGFDYQEIAQIQSLTEDQVRFNIHSAELFLHERLGETRGAA